MADEQHLEILRKGVKAWNQWREDNPHFKPDLNQANLQNSKLNGIDLKNTKLVGANLKCAELNNANLRCTKLQDADLLLAQLVDSDLYGSELSGANLQCAELNDANLIFANLQCTVLNGANLSGAKLARTNFCSANLCSANLSFSTLVLTNFTSADLTNVNLTGATAFITNFEGVTFIGACFYNTYIDSQSNFLNIKCDYIYYKNVLCKEKGECIFSDRRPHDPNKNFAPGEFTQLFQKALETVDLIFSDGVDWKAFLVSFNKLQIECDSDELSINSFENKGNGAFVIRVNVPDGADKAEIEKYLRKQYQLEATVEAQQKEITDLLEITKLLANRPTTENRIQGDYYEQSGKFGIGNNQGYISGDTKIAGEINEAKEE